MATVREGFTAIQDAKASYLDGKEISVETANFIGEAIVSNLDLRDYFLGLPSEMSLDNCISFMETLITITDEKYLHAHYTILSAYQYELGAKDVAYLALISAKSLCPNYALLGLLERVFEAGWSSEGFASMRGSLHHKVVATINKTNEQELITH